MNKHHFYPEHLKPLKYFALTMFVLLPFLSFLIGAAYEEMKFVDAADPRTRIFMTQQECESFTDRKCVPTLCESDPQHVSCKINNQTGWFATRQPLDSSNPDTGIPTESPNALQCMNAGGKWMPEYNECEGLTKEQCMTSGGDFNDCASACRHNPAEAMCIQMCIPVCTFK